MEGEHCPFNCKPRFYGALNNKDLSLSENCTRIRINLLIYRLQPDQFKKLNIKYREVGVQSDLSHPRANPELVGGKREMQLRPPIGRTGDPPSSDWPSRSRSSQRG